MMVTQSKAIEAILSRTEKEKQTNFSRITASPEALAEFFAWQLSQLNDIHECDIPIDADDNLFKKEFWITWLKQESDTE